MLNYTTAKRNNDETILAAQPTDVLQRIQILLLYLKIGQREKNFNQVHITYLVKITVFKNIS
jgi:hypothetical protein